MLSVLPNQQLLSTDALDPIMLWFKAGLLVAVIIASPLIMLQVWYFIAPGLYAKEKRIAVPFVFSSSALFVAGAYFWHRVAFQVTWISWPPSTRGFRSRTGCQPPLQRFPCI